MSVAVGEISPSISIGAVLTVPRAFDKSDVLELTRSVEGVGEVASYGIGPSDIDQLGIMSDLSSRFEGPVLRMFDGRELEPGQINPVELAKAGMDLAVMRFGFAGDVAAKARDLAAYGIGTIVRPKIMPSYPGENPNLKEIRAGIDAALLELPGPAKRVLIPANLNRNGAVSLVNLVQYHLETQYPVPAPTPMGGIRRTLTTAPPACIYVEGQDPRIPNVPRLSLDSRCRPHRYRCFVDGAKVLESHDPIATLKESVQMFRERLAA